MVAARCLEPQSKLATTRWWHTTALPRLLSIQDATEEDLYAAMDWLPKTQDAIEAKLAGGMWRRDAARSTICPQPILKATY